MTEFKNKSRAEGILENMLGASNTLKPPQSRVEYLLMQLFDLIDDIAHGSGTIFRLLGEKEYVDDLPETGNEQGDVWFVKEKMAGFIWLVREDHPDGYWEELGEVIDTSSLVNSVNGQTGNVVLSPIDIGAAPETEHVIIDTSGDVSQTLDPNKVYVFTGDLTSLTLTLNTPILGKANIYQVFFRNGASAVTLFIPNSVMIDTDFIPEAGSWTELSVQYIYSVTNSGTTSHHYIARGYNMPEAIK